MTMLGRYDFAIRYTNAPGNLVWPFLFLSFAWSPQIKNYYALVGALSMIVTIATLSSNLVHWYSAFSRSLRKPIYLAWLASLLIMLVN